MRRHPLIVGLAALALAFGWQALTVHYNYGGNWTALFCTGSQLRVPPQLAEEKIYQFPGSSGYDGQFYHYEAHDPLMRRGITEYLDAARLRYRRILLPAAAYVLAFGQDRLVDLAFHGLILISVFLGAWWLSRCASLLDLHPAWGLGFLMLPATLISIDRSVVDMTLVALTIGFAYYAREGPLWKCWLVLACAVLTRETGVVLLAGYCAYLFLHRLWVRLALSAAAGLPALAWYAYVQQRTRGDGTDLFAIFVNEHFNAPWLIPRLYGFPQPIGSILVLLDYLSLAGVALALLLAARGVLRRPRGILELAGLAFLGMSVWTLAKVLPGDPFTLPRVLSPLLVLVVLVNPRAGIVPIALMSARVGAQLAPQVLGVLRGLFR